jgi:hypothetical protein
MKENKEKRRSNGSKLVGVILISARFVSTERERERYGGGMTKQQYYLV